MSDTHQTTVEIVRRRLADGRTIADADVHRLVAEIEHLRSVILRLIREGNDCMTPCIEKPGWPPNDRCSCMVEAEAEIAAETDSNG